MKVQTCSFSGYRVLNGRGLRYVRLDGHSFVFFSQKCRRHFLAKRNPRKCSWTLLYRQAHRKGLHEEVASKKRRKVAKTEKGLAGMSLEEIRKLRNQTPEYRQAQRDAAIKAIKDRIKSIAAKKAEKRKAAAAEKKAAEEKAAAEQGKSKKEAKKDAKKQAKKAKKQMAPQQKPQASKTKAPKGKVDAKSR